jgi:DnaJ-class molecular chaperone
MKIAPDYYAVIQVDPRAERGVIDAAYRRLASRYHPDVDPSPGATERMKLINAAYEVLSDPSKRSAYDLSRAVAPRQPPHSQPRSSTPQVGFDWLSTIVVTGLMLALTAAGPRFGLRSVIVVGLLFLAGWLVMSLRKR